MEMPRSMSREARDNAAIQVLRFMAQRPLLDISIIN
jgi:hypothetical protein